MLRTDMISLLLMFVSIFTTTSVTASSDPRPGTEPEPLGNDGEALLCIPPVPPADGEASFFKMCETPWKPDDVLISTSHGGVGWNKASYWPGTRLTFHCKNLDYMLIPQDATMYCTKNGDWSPNQVPICYKPAGRYKRCNRPEVENGYWVCGIGEDCEKLLQGTQIKISCNEGYHLTGTALVKCQSDGRWLPEMPTCQSTIPTCPPLSPIANGTFHCITDNCQRYQVRTMVDVVCNQGFALMGKPTLSCREDSTWSSEMPHCIPLPSQSCVPYKIQHGQWEVGEYDMKYALFGVGASIVYHCESGYDLQGESRLVCNEEGHWSTYPPKCNPKILCPDPGPVDNGRFECADLSFSCQEYSAVCGQVDTRLVFVCDDGYHRLGERQITCKDDGKWSADKPVCTRVSSTTVPATSRSLNSTTTVVIVTACSVMGVLMVMMLVVAIYRRKPQRHLVHQIASSPPPYSQTYSPPPPPSDIDQNHDRLALIAYDGVTLPSYEEVMTSSRRHRMPSRHQSDATSRHSVLTNSTANRDGLSAFGSLDTVNMSTANLSTVASTDNTSTSVTVDTYDSGASVPSIAMTSRRAVAGSLASTSDSSSPHKEESPLLEPMPGDEGSPSHAVELEEIKDD